MRFDARTLYYRNRHRALRFLFYESDPMHTPTTNLPVLEMLQNVSGHAPPISEMSVFNADFAGLAGLSPEQLKEIEPFKDRVLEAERLFRVADDAFRDQEERDRQAIEVAKHNLKSTQASRHRAATDFDRGKASLEAPLKPFGVTVSWDEPQVDAVHLGEVYG